MEKSNNSKISETENSQPAFRRESSQPAPYARSANNESRNNDFGVVIWHNIRILPPMRSSWFSQDFRNAHLQATNRVMKIRISKGSVFPENNIRDELGVKVF